ncbi:MAG: ATP-dependent helicase [Acidimicrobiales bacterium]
MSRPVEIPVATFPEMPSGITAAQREAVMSNSPVLCVLAGAGTGKTGVLTLRVARRSMDGTAAAERSLVCTFSRKAADELRSRLFRLGVSGVKSGTIHRLALGILRDWRQHISRGVPIVLDDRRRLIESLLPDQPTARTAMHVEGEIGWAKARMVAPAEYEEAARCARRVVRVPTALTAELYAAYEAEKARRGVSDLDDLLLESASAMLGDDRFAEAVRWRYRHLYVDEMQDVNAAQFRLLRTLMSTQPDLFVVGDPDQSVYGWNGSDPDLLARLPEIFPETEVISLDDNHRCTPSIVRVATAALGRPSTSPSSTRPEGPLPVISSHDTDRDEARWIARQAWLAHRPGRRWGHLAVLARTNAQLKLIAEVLGEQRIPFTFAGGDLTPASDLDAPPEDELAHPADAARSAAPGEPPDGVVLSTFHRAKGLQWPCVFVVGISEGLVPIYSARSITAIEEERRLLYVAMTRAEDQLWCSWARTNDNGSRSARKPSRWIGAIEETTKTVEHEQAPAKPESVASHIARLRAMVSRTTSEAGPPSGPQVRSTMTGA